MKNPSDLAKHISEVERLARFTDFVEQSFEGSPTPKTRMGLKDKEVERFFELATRLLNEDKFEEAADALLVVCTLDPDQYNQWMALGLAERKAKNICGALEAYAMASLVNPTEPLPHVHASQCYMLMQRFESARNSLVMAGQTAGADSRFKDLIREVNKMKRGLDQKLAQAEERGKRK